MPSFPAAALPLDDQSYVLGLKSMRANILNEILVEQNARLTKGVTKTTYSLDGRNIEWNEWLDGMRKRLEELDKQIQSMDQPWEIYTRGYT